jgi:predicted N-acetyltransferase YhbS
VTPFQSKIHSNARNHLSAVRADREYSPAIPVGSGLHAVADYTSVRTIGGPVEKLAYRIAESSDFEAIHRLNYETFVEEIPQHAPNPERRLVDRFHAENTYVICLADSHLIGMVCGRCERPFSLDQKLADLDRWLPTHRKAVEIRLLSVARAWRKTSVFRGLMTFLSSHFVAQRCDLAVISGTVRELKLYRHLGFECFGERVGPADASYQPMYLTLDAFNRTFQ